MTVMTFVLVCLVCGCVAEPTPPVSMLTAAEPDPSVDPGSPPGAEPDPEPEVGVLCGDTAAGLVIAGSVFFDLNDNSNTLYDVKVDGGDTPIDGEVEITLTQPSGASTVGQTCEGGRFEFSSLEPGDHLLEVQPAQGWVCTSSNRGVRLGEAIREGAVDVFAFGDSVPHFGPEPWFPARFGEIVSAFATVEVTNRAVPGSHSYEWLPGTRFFENRIRPQLAERDVIIFSLGGNDLDAFVGSIEPDPEEILAKADEFVLLVDEILDNLETIVAAIRDENPAADIVWLIYPNYAKSSAWGEIAGEYQSVVSLVLEGEIKRIRQRMGEVPGLQLVDLFSAIGEDIIDTLLLDQLHYNEVGHSFLAVEVFKTLGGVRISPEAPEQVRHFSFRP